MKKKKLFLMFFVLLFFTGQAVFAADDIGRCPEEGREISYYVSSTVDRGSHLGGLYFGDNFSSGLDFQDESFKLNLFAKLNNRNINLQTLIPEFKNFGDIGNLEASDHGFRYYFTKNQLKLLNGLYNDSVINIAYNAKLNKDAFVYDPKRDECSVNYGNSPRHDSSPAYFESDGSKITVVWDDDNDRDGIRTKQEVYYLKLDAGDPNNGPLFKVLEIPSRGTNEEEQYFYNVPITWTEYEEAWKYYNLDGRNIDKYEKIISEDKVKITYRHIPEKIDFKVNVVWEDKNNKYNTRPEDFNFTISPQGMGKDYSVKSSNNWSKSFQEYKFEEGKEIRYNLKFPDIDKYKKEVKREGNNYTVTYTSKIIEAEEIKPIATKNIVATKTWVNGREEDHKKVNLELYRKTNLSEKELLNIDPEVKEENDKFIYTWKELPATNPKGEVYNYSVKEVEVPENYKVSYKDLNVTNTYKSPTKDVEVKVVWLGGDPKDTKIILYRKNLNSDLEEVGVFNSNKDNLSKTFERLPVTDEKGQEYTYYAYEPEVPEGFAVSYSDDKLTVINTKKPEVKPEPDPEVKPEPDPEVKPEPDPEVKPEPDPEVRPETKPDPKPDSQVIEKTEGPLFKRHDYTPTYPVVTRVPEEDSLKYIFTIDDYNYKEIRNGITRYYKMDVAPLIKNDRTMLPLRYVGEALDAEVKWDEETRTAIFIKNGRRTEIQIDNDEIVLSNEEIIKMDSKPLNINSRILVPVTNVANVFGLTNGNTEDNIKQDIEWDKDSRTVTIYVR